MKNKITIFIFLILIINGVYALSGAYNTDMGGNLMDSITDQQNRPADPVPENSSLVVEPNLQNTASEIILDEDMVSSLIEKVNFVGYNSESVGAFGYMPILNTRRSIPYFTLNYETEEKYQTNDTNVTVYLDSDDFNFNSEIYALVATPENYNDLIPEINNFIKTQNSEYVNFQQYLELPISNGYSVDCYCKQKDTPSSRYIFTTGWGFTPVIGNPNSAENKIIINEFCQDICVTKKIENDNLENLSQNTSKIYEYDLDNYDLEIILPFEVLNNYKLTKTQSIDKIKFLPNGNTFQFTIERNNPNKKFVIVFLQKDNKRLNISYSNFYVLNNDEIIKYYHCEANRNVLSFFCNKYMDSRCGIFKSCFNEYDLNFNAIDISEFVYSSISSNTTETILQTPPSVLETAVEENTTVIAPIAPITEEITYYSTNKLTGDNCTNAGLTLNNWGCVCSISSSGVKRVVAGKCRSNYGLVLYGIPQKAQVPVTYQFCYSEPSTMCR